MSCEDPSNDGEFRVVIPASISGISRTSRLDCSLQIGAVSGLNEIELRVLDAVGNNLYSWKIELAVNSEVQESKMATFFSENGLLKGLMLTFGGVILTLVGIIILQKRSESYEEIEEQQNYQNVVPHSNYNSVQTVQNQTQYQQTVMSQTPTVQQTHVNQFSQPSSRPPANESINLQDAFGSLMPDNEDDGVN